MTEPLFASRKELEAKDTSRKHTTKDVSTNTNLTTKTTLTYLTMTNKNLPGMATATPGKHPPPATPEATSTYAAPYDVDSWLKAQETSSPKPPAQNSWNIVSKKRTYVDVASDET